MIFSKDVLFIHVPKTGGVSVTQYLLQVLPRPIYYVHSGTSISTEGVVRISRDRHATMREARALVRDHGFDLEQFPSILAVIRNPYETAVSWYGHFQVDSPWRRGWSQEMAMQSDFESFVLAHQARLRPGELIEPFLLLDGSFPPNLHIVRYESLVKGVKAELQRVGISIDAPFPWENRSQHGPIASYYTPAAEKAVYHLYRWVFDQGYYARMDVPTMQRALVDARPSGYRPPRELIRNSLEQVAMPGSTVLVVSKGDESLLDLPDWSAQHFPQAAGGEYAGYYPGSAQEAIDHLEHLRKRGAEYLIFPAATYWWFRHYAAFKQHLDYSYRSIVTDGCIVFQLAEPAPA